MSADQERKPSLWIRQHRTPTYILAFIFAILVGVALLTTPVGWTARGLPVRDGHPPFVPACTSFCLDNGRHAVFGANYDNAFPEGLVFVNKRGVTKTGWETGTTGKYARWTAEYGSVTFNLVGAQMAWAGMNEAGLVISTMWLGETRQPAPDERPPLVSPLWVQYQLDTCATLQDVMVNDARVRITDAVDHYLICDRSGTCAAVEFLEGETLFHTGDAMPVNALANDPYLEAVGAWRARRLTGNSLERFDVAADGVTDYQPRDVPSAVAHAFEILDQASIPPTAETPTQWSIVFDTKNLRVHFRTSRNPQARSVEFAQLDFACGTRRHMLDIHAPLSGDISRKLGRFRFRAILQQTLNFLEAWGRDMSPLEVEVLERGVTSFPCGRMAAPYQEEGQLAVSPLVGWAALALLHRIWLVGLVVVCGVAALVLVVWRVRARGRRA